MTSFCNRWAISSPSFHLIMLPMYFYFLKIPTWLFFVRDMYECLIFESNNEWELTSEELHNMLNNHFVKVLVIIKNLCWHLWINVYAHTLNISLYKYRFIPSRAQHDVISHFVYSPTKQLTWWTPLFQMQPSPSIHCRLCSIQVLLATVWSMNSQGIKNDLLGAAMERTSSQIQSKAWATTDSMPPLCPSSLWPHQLLARATGPEYFPLQDISPHVVHKVTS